MRSSDPDVVCLRPEEDFLRVQVTPPGALSIAYRAVDDPDVEELISGARALVLPSYGPRLHDRLLAYAPRLRLIQFTGAGVDRVDGDAATRRGIAVCGVAGTNATTVAQYVVGTAITLLRRLPEAHARVRAGDYAAARAQLLATAALRDLSGLVVGIVGMGNIGRAVAAAFRALEPTCSVVYHDPVPHEPAHAGARRASLDEVLRTSDVVTLHVPITPATAGLIGPAELALMQSDAILVQAARGGVVDEAALADALAAGRLAGAAVDVYEQEPPAPASPLLALAGDRVLLSPHIGGVCIQSEQRQFSATWRNVERVLLDGGEPHGAVAPQHQSTNQ